MSPARHPKPIWRRILTVLWQQPIWAIPFTIFFGTLYGGGWGSYWTAFRISLAFAYSIGFAILATEIFVLPRLPHRAGGRGPGETLEIALAFGIAAMVGSYLGATLIHFTLLPGFLGGARAIAITGMYSALFITLVGGLRFAKAYHSLAVERARAVEQMRTELAQAELRALKAQIHPHFLFNTLNSIASLIATQPSAAEDVTTRLADLFRYTLRASEREQATLGEEFQFLRDYLEIERIRFGDRLRIEETVEPGLETCSVPSLLLQPLVENAVRHAVATRAEGGRIRLAARREGHRLVLEVMDDGPGIDPDAPPSGTGFGLHSIRERLRAGGLDGALTLESPPGGGARARVSLPLTIDGTAAAVTSPTQGVSS